MPARPATATFSSKVKLTMISGPRPGIGLSALMRLSGNVPGRRPYRSLTKIAPNCGRLCVLVAGGGPVFGGAHVFGVAVRDEQIVASRVGRNHDGARWKRFGHGVSGRRVLLFPTADLALLVLPRGMKLGSVLQDPRQRRHVSAAGAVVGLEAVQGQQFGGAHESRDRKAVRIDRSHASVD